MKNYMQHLKERAISAYPPKTSRRWSICIAAAVIIGLLLSHFGQAKFGASLADFALLCGIDFCQARGQYFSGLLTGGSLVFCGFCLIDFLHHVIQQFIRKKKQLTSS